MSDTEANVLAWIQKGWSTEGIQLEKLLEAAGA